MSFLLRALSLCTALVISSTLLAQSQYPITVTDGMGNSLTFDKEPALVSSKTLFTDEILTSLLDPQRLSSLTNFANEAHYSNISDALPEGVALLDFNVEAILNNYPDIVFAANWSDAGKVEQLKKAGIAVYLVNTPFTVEAIQAEIVKLGKILNANDQADALITQMNEQLNALADKKADLQQEKLVALDYNSWGTASGIDTTWNAVLTHAGIINGSAAFEQGAFGQVSMSKELIVEINPDILFLPGWIYGESDAAANFVKATMNDPALQNVTAIKTGHVYQVPEGLRGTYSQYIIDTIRYVVDTVHADLAQ